MPNKLTDAENGCVGVVAGTADILLVTAAPQPRAPPPCLGPLLSFALPHAQMHWTVSAKNNSQQGLPFETNPVKLYRGCIANIINNSFCVGSQFLLNGLVKQAVLQGADRPLTPLEQVGAGGAAGALSGIVCGPIELVMIQQQRRGTGLLPTTAEMIKGGPSTFFRGTPGMMGREGLFCAGYLGLMPVARQHFRATFPDSIGATEDSARLAATLTAGPICSLGSHPCDTLKTVLQVRSKSRLA
jgi:hypothetical protein